MKYLLLGNINANDTGGQCVKTRMIYKLFVEKGVDIESFDTYTLKSVSSFMILLKKIKNCNALIYLPAENNLKYLLPVIYPFLILWGVKVFYYVVGGWLTSFLGNRYILQNIIKKFAGVFPETKLLKDELEKKYGFENVVCFPNFRFCDIPYNPTHEKGHLNIVFFARIVMEKGLDVVFALSDRISKMNLMKEFTIDFYGPIADKDKEYFEKNVDKYEFVNYRGVISDSVYPILQKYDVLVLPTHYKTEGIPGSVVEAFLSGIPVVVTDWMYANELVSDKIDGIIVPFDNCQLKFEEAVFSLLKNEKLLDEMKIAAYKKGRLFSSDFVWSIIEDKILKK